MKLKDLKIGDRFQMSCYSKPGRDPYYVNEGVSEKYTSLNGRQMNIIKRIEDGFTIGIDANKEVFNIITK